MKGQNIKIAAVGDVALLQKPTKNLWTEIWDQASIRLANLEAPIVSTPGPPADKLIRIKQPPETGDWLQQLNVTAVSLANNHILDWGVEGLHQTISSLSEKGIDYSGAGITIEVAVKPSIFEINGYKIAFLSWSCTVPKGFRALSNRAGMASVRIMSFYEVDGEIADEQPGTPPWVETIPVEEDIRYLETVIRDWKQKSDFVILAIHWGIPPQWGSVYQGPIAEYQEILSERVAAAGVDLVLGHHAHAPYGIEAYSTEKNLGKFTEVPVLYSLGNFIFHHEYLPNGFDVSSSGDRASVPPQLPENHQSCIVEIELEPGEQEKLAIKKITFFPAILNEFGEAVKADLETNKVILERLHTFSRQRNTNTTIEKDRLIWKPQAN